MLFSVFISACKGDINDLNKQVEKMDEIINNDEIFDEDYKVIGKITQNEESLSYVLLLDDYNYYLEFDHGNAVDKYYFIKERNSYLLFVEGKNQYTSVDSNEVENLIVLLFANRGINVVVDLKQLYVNVSHNLKTFIDKCSNDNNYNCDYQKESFSKLIFTSTYDITLELKSIISYSLSKGKIIKTFSQTSDSEVTYIKENNYEYDDQDIKIPMKSDYQFEENLLL